MCLGLLDTDLVVEPGVGVRLIYATMLLRIEQEIEQCTSKALDLEERHLVKSVQRQVVAIGSAQVDLAKAKANRQKWINEGICLRSEWSFLEHKVKDLEDCKMSLGP